MLKAYIKTHLEDFVEQFYTQSGIIEPNQITIDNLSKAAGVIVEYIFAAGASIRNDRGRSVIFIDKRLSASQQREEFLHELGHILRHAGNQLKLPEPFVQYQENDTEHFVIYALMPIHMVQRLELSPDRKQAIQQIANAFTVGTELASRRYDQIVRRIAAMTPINKHLKEEVSAVEIDQPQFAVYYDPSGTLDGPSQMVVNLDEWTLINCREIELPIGERLPEIDQDELVTFDGAPALPGDVVCFDGVVSLQVHNLLHRHGLSRRKFVIHMHTVDMLRARDDLWSRRLDW